MKKMNTDWSLPGGRLFMFGVRQLGKVEGHFKPHVYHIPKLTDEVKINFMYIEKLLLLMVKY